MANIDFKNMEKLIALMVENDLSALHYEHGELKIELKRGCTSPTTVFAAPPAAPRQSTVPVAEHPPDANAGLVPIASPMVGTFYAAPDPESPPP